MSLISAMAGMMALGGSSGGSTPTLLSVTGQSFNTNAMTHNVNMPAVVNNGDLLVCLVSIPATNTVTATGFTNAGSQSGSSARFQVLYRLADGTEGGTTVNFFTTTNLGMAVQTFRIQAGTFDAATPPQLSFSAFTNSNTPDPPSLSPSWGLASTLWIIAQSTFTTATVSSYPTANNNNFQASTSGLGRHIASCTANDIAASLDPGTFTISIVANWIAATIGIKPN